MNYIHNEAGWPIKTKSLVENLNIYEMQKQTCEHVNLKYREGKINITSIWMILGWIKAIYSILEKSKVIFVLMSNVNNLRTYKS